MEGWIIAVAAVLGLLLTCAFMPFPELLLDLLERIPSITVAVEEGRLCKHCCVVDLPLLHLT